MLSLSILGAVVALVSQHSMYSHTEDFSREVLAFKLGDEEYGIDILSVQEIRGYESVTRIANAPAFLKGVLNLRGVIVPVVDMRIKFNLANPTYDATTVVIVLNLGKATVGMVVDSVSDVSNLSSDQIRPAPDLGAAVSADYLLGLCTLGERMLILVDIGRLISSSELLGYADGPAA